MTSPKSDSVSELILTLGLLIRKIRSAAPPELREFSWTQKAVIARLDKEGPSTTADLARAEGVKPQSMATAITALEAQGFISRRPHPTDGRQVNIEITAQGKSMRKTTTDAKHAWLTQAIEKLDKRDQATLFAAGEILRRMADS